jgi:hypothetical protein
MKILCTAFNSAALTEATHRWHIRNAVGAYVAALRDLGHDVDWRRSTMDDADLVQTRRDQYDVIIANVVPPLSLVAIDWIPVVRLMNAATERGIPVIMSIDDWNTDNVTRRVERNGENPSLVLGKDFHAKRAGYEWAMADHDRYVRMCFDFAATKFPTLVCAYEFGTAEGFARLASRLPGRVYQLDPTPYVHHNYYPQMPAKRDRVWVMSSLACHNKWLSEHEWKWPGEYYLTVGEKWPPPPGWEIHPPIKQHDIIERYGQVWGVLLQPYKRMLSSGWWRDRWVTATRSGTVLYVDPADAGRLTDHNFRREIGDIENMSTEDLARLANRQREEIEDWLWTKERLQRELSLVLELECR